MYMYTKSSLNVTEMCERYSEMHERVNQVLALGLLDSLGIDHLY